MSILSQPEFRVPIDRVVPGMVLSRNLEHRGTLLLRFGVELDEEKLTRIAAMGVPYLHVHFANQDLRLLKELLIAQDNPPSYERLVGLVREAFYEFIPNYARPEHCTRDQAVGETVREIVRHTFDIIFSSRRCFELLRQTRFFQVSYLRHCPAAWVYSLCVGCTLGYNMPTLLDLSFAAMFYDIGMLKVQPKILAKPGRLTDLEYAEIKKHTYFGRKMLEEISDFSASAATVAFQHQEFYYGGGYPKNKRGDEIHEFSQIVGLTDKFAALVSVRNYRKNFQPYEAYEMLLAQTKSAVCPKVFVAFLKSVLLYPRGSMFKLSTGEIAQPIDFPLHMPTRPTVRITHSSTGEELFGLERIIKLAEQPEIKVESFSLPDEQTARFAPETQNHYE